MADETPSSVQPALYFANAAAGIMLPGAAEATIGHLRRETEIGAPPAAAEANDALTQGYLAAARLIGAAVDEVAFVESGNRALAALIQSASLRSGDHVLVDRTCWGGTLAMLESYPGVVVDVMPVDAHGRVDVDEARRLADPATKLVVLTWCPATCGIFNPAEETGALAAELGAFYIVDACQGSVSVRWMLRSSAATGWPPAVGSGSAARGERRCSSHRGSISRPRRPLWPISSGGAVRMPGATKPAKPM